MLSAGAWKMKITTHVRRCFSDQCLIYGPCSKCLDGVSCSYATHCFFSDLASAGLESPIQRRHLFTLPQGLEQVWLLRWLGFFLFCFLLWETRPSGRSCARGLGPLEPSTWEKIFICLSKIIFICLSKIIINYISHIIEIMISYRDW